MSCNPLYGMVNHNRYLLKNLALLNLDELDIEALQTHAAISKVAKCSLVGKLSNIEMQNRVKGPFSSLLCRVCLASHYK